MTNGPTDWSAMDLRIETIDPLVAVTPTTLRDRLRLTGVGLGEGLLLAPAIPLLVLTLLSIPLTLVAGVGILIAAAGRARDGTAHPGPAVPGERRSWASRCRRGTPRTAGRNVLTRPVVWIRDEARWRDFAWLAFAATGGAVMSMLPAALLSSWVTWIVIFLIEQSWGWALFVVVLSGPLLLAWWLITPALIRARAVADRAILGPPATEVLERRVSEVTASRSETLDHSAAEIRRIERDLHDGAQARIVSVGINLGLAEQLVATDPEAAADLMREARESTVTALSDLRTVVRGIHPPALADRGLAGGVEALAADLPLPVTLTIEDLGALPAPLETAAYFAVAECFANIVKHAGAKRAWVRMARRGGVVAIEVGDDGHGGADPGGSGLSGVARRLAAFDGTVGVSSPEGGPTVVTLELPCG